MPATGIADIAVGLARALIAAAVYCGAATITTTTGEAASWRVFLRAVLAWVAGVLAVRSRPVAGQDDRGGAKVRPGR